ncbi:MAG: 2-oxoacid:acceptor oxidoreductase subunit alpha [Candidatus Woesearchaeota archaeon]
MSAIKKSAIKKLLSKKDIQWKLGGEAGFGIMVTGLMFSKMCSRSGLHIFDYIEYPSIIRGGHNTYQVRASKTEIFSQKKEVDILVALNKETVDKHADELCEGAFIIYDENEFKLDESKLKKYNLIKLPWKKMAQELHLSHLMVNNIAFGASASLLNIDTKVMKKVITDLFKEKGKTVIEGNHKAAIAGYNFIKSNLEDKRSKKSFSKSSKTKKIVITGNEAIGIGAIAASCDVYVAYPMTPASSILHFMAAHQEKYGYVVKHAEDEISVINMTIGAGFAGARSMCATSGGGFCLMSEGYSLAGMTETPCVIVNVQRPGPATGVPTWTEQGELKLALGAGHGEFPRIILAPGDVEEAFALTGEAFNIAEKYQTPVLILSDKYLSESHKSTKNITKKVKINRGLRVKQSSLTAKKAYKRYALTKSGISPRAVPGQKYATVRANSDEHDEFGFSREETEIRNSMVEKRMNKQELYKKEMPSPNIYGDRKADITIVSWGSTKGPILEAMKLLKEEKVKARLMHLNYIFPFPDKFVSNILKNSKKTIIIENNQTGQMADLIRQCTGIKIKEKFLKYDARPFYPEEIKEKIIKLAKK